MTWPYESASQISLPNDADTARILSPISKASYVGSSGTKTQYAPPSLPRANLS
jgi:hypothetical protein